MSRPRVLIVEDEQIVAADLRMTLEGLGYDVVSTADSHGKAIREVARTQPDVVLMDIQLRGLMDGIVAAEEIRQGWHIPVVFVTANANEETMARARESGPYGYVLKPFRPKDLNATVLVALHQHRLARELFAEHTWLRTTMASLSDGVIVADAAGRVRYLNPAGEKLTGWSLEEATGRPIDEVYLTATNDSNGCGISGIAAAGSGKVRQEIRSRDGRTIPVEAWSGPIPEGEQVAGRMLVFLDITDRLRREREQEAERDRLEEQVQATVEELGHTRAELRALSGYLLTAQEGERRRVARELHDDLSQRAAVAEMQLQRVEQFVEPGAGVSALEKLREHLAELSAGLREVSHQLHPSVIMHLGLAPALQQLVGEFRRAGSDVSLIERGLVTSPGVEVSTALYRIAQEALRNAMKHAAGAPVQVELEEQPQQLSMAIRDAGPGFDLTEARSNGGLGLLSMQERARRIGGKFTVRTARGAGTLILVAVPLQST